MPDKQYGDLLDAVLKQNETLGRVTQSIGDMRDLLITLVDSSRSMEKKLMGYDYSLAEMKKEIEDTKTVANANKSIIGVSTQKVERMWEQLYGGHDKSDGLVVDVKVMKDLHREGRGAVRILGWLAGFLGLGTIGGIVMILKLYSEVPVRHVPVPAHIVKEIEAN